MQRLFLAFHDVERGVDDEAYREDLNRVAVAAHELGVRVEETFYSIPAGRAFSILETDTDQRVRDVFARGGLPDPEVLPVKRVFTGLLDEERLERVH